VLTEKWVHIKANQFEFPFKNYNHHKKEAEVVNALSTSKSRTEEERGKHRSD
jgi:hypothetical protein